MKARMHLTGPMKKVIEEYANEIVEQRRDFLLQTVDNYL